MRSYIRSCLQCVYNKVLVCNTKLISQKTIKKMHKTWDTLPSNYPGLFVESSKRIEHLTLIIDAFNKYVFL